jgi:hypothetical protein
LATNSHTGQTAGAKREPYEDCDDEGRRGAHVDSHGGLGQEPDFAKQRQKHNPLDHDFEEHQHHLRPSVRGATRSNRDEEQCDAEGHCGEPKYRRQ